MHQLSLQITSASALFSSLIDKRSDRVTEIKSRKISTVFVHRYTVHNWRLANTPILYLQ